MAQRLLINRPERPGVLADWRELWAYRELVREFTARSLALRYKNSVLGVGWSMATPLMMVLVITLMTKYLMNQGIPSYSAYLFPVMFAWNFTQTTTADMCCALLENASLVKKCAFPRELLPIATLLANLFHFGLALVITLVYLVYLRIFPQQISWQVLLVLLIVPAQCALLLGLGFLVSALNVLFEDIRFIVTVLMQLLFYAAPVIYPIESVAASQAHHPDHAIWSHILDLYLLNPFAAILVLYQKALLPPIQHAATAALPWSWGLLGRVWLESLLVLGVGMWLFNRIKHAAVERL